MKNTVFKDLPMYGQATNGTKFLLLSESGPGFRRWLHTTLARRARASGSIGVVTLRGTPGQLFQIDGGIQIPIQHQTTLLAVERPV